MHREQKHACKHTCTDSTHIHVRTHAYMHALAHTQTHTQKTLPHSTFTQHYHTLLHSTITQRHHTAENERQTTGGNQKKQTQNKRSFQHPIPCKRKCPLMCVYVCAALVILTLICYLFFSVTIYNNMQCM